MNQTLEYETVQSVVMDILAKGMGVQQKAAGAPINPYTHGPGGIFGVPGLSRDLIHTHSTPKGLVGQLPIRFTNEMTPIFGYITGFVKSDADEPAGACDDPPMAGPIKTCFQTAQFGLKSFKTREIDVRRVGEVINRGEFDDLRVVNSPLVPQIAGLLSQRFAFGGQAQALGAGREMLMRFLEVGVAFQRWLCPQVYIGNPVNGNGGGYKEFPGLDLLINRNKVDAFSGADCPSLYSTVLDFEYNDVASTTATHRIIHTLTRVMHYLNNKATKHSFDSVDWRFVMRDGLFYELTRIWPCQYNTYRCTSYEDSSGIDPVGSFDSVAMTKMRDDMYNGRYLVIDGRRYPVIIDDCIDEDFNSDVADIPVGYAASDIYIIPMSAMNGNYPLTYLQAKDYSNTAMRAVSDVPGASSVFWTDGGAFLWALQPLVRFCLDAVASIEPRLILRAPHLSARIQNVAYSTFIHEDDVLPEQPYWLDGGNPTGIPAPSPFSEWNADGPGTWPS